MSSLAESQVDLDWSCLHVGEILSPCWWSVLTYNALNACKYTGNFINYRTQSDLALPKALLTACTSVKAKLRQKILVVVQKKD